MKKLHKKCGLAVASTILALVLLISFVDFAQGQPGQPTLVSPENSQNISDNTPLMDWGDVTAATNYHIQIDNDSGYSSPNVDNDNVGGASQYTVPDENQLPDGVYYWHVRAENADGYSPWSENRIFRVDTLAPLAPTMVSPDNGAQTADSTPTLSWNAVSDDSLPVTYDLQVDNDPDFSSPEENVSGLTDNSYTTSSLADSTWYWRVRVRDNAGNSGNWSSWLFTVETTSAATIIVGGILLTFSILGMLSFLSWLLGKVVGGKEVPPPEEIPKEVAPEKEIEKLAVISAAVSSYLERPVERLIGIFAPITNKWGLAGRREMMASRPFMDTHRWAPRTASKWSLAGRRRLIGKFPRRE